MKKQHVQLTDDQRRFLEDLLRKGDLSVKTYQRALALLELDRGKSYTMLAQTLTVASQILSNWAAKYEAEGLKMLVVAQGAKGDRDRWAAHQVIHEFRVTSGFGGGRHGPRRFASRPSSVPGFLAMDRPWQGTQTGGASYMGMPSLFFI